MGLLDDDTPSMNLYTPPTSGKRFRKDTVLSQEQRDAELNRIREDDDEPMQIE